MIGKKIGTHKSGSYLVYKAFSDYYKEFVDFTDNEFCDISGYNKIIYCCHQSFLYKNLTIKLLTSLKNKHVLFTRNYNSNISYYNTATNGFSIYKQHKSIKNFIPVISLPHNNSVDYKKHCNVFGFYNRTMTNRSTVFLLNILLKYKNVKLVTCGKYIKGYSSICKNYKHTYDSTEFFNSIDNYIHLQSDYIDPVPNMLLEAFYNNKNVISFPIVSRKHKDGCDDILGMFDYYNFLDFNYNYQHINNYSNIQLLNKLHIYYRKLINNEFNYRFSRDKYNTFKEWVLDI